MSILTATFESLAFAVLLCQLVDTSASLRKNSASTSSEKSSDRGGQQALSPSQQFLGGQSSSSSERQGAASPPTRLPPKGSSASAETGIDGLSSSEIVNPSGPLNVPNEITLELAMFTDEPLWHHVQKHFPLNNTEEVIKRFVVSTVGSVAQVFKHPSMKPKLSVKLVKLKIAEGPVEQFCDSCIGKQGDTVDPSRLLEAFIPLQKEGNWDASILLSGLKFSGAESLRSTRLGGICSQNERAVIHSAFDSAGDLAVQLAYLLGMESDLSNKGSAPTDVQVERGFIWSARRMGQLRKKLESLGSENCLLKSSQDSTEFELPREPGETFDVISLCQWMSEGSRPSKPRFPGHLNTCVRVVCVNASSENEAPFATTSVIPFYASPCAEFRFCGISMDWGNLTTACVSKRKAEYDGIAKYNFAYGDCEGSALLDEDSQQPIVILGGDQDQCAASCDQIDACKAFVFWEGQCFPKAGHCDLQLSNEGNTNYEFYLKKF